jgi:hypothetical protein
LHGPRCAPGSTPSRRYGCVGDFKKAWHTALRKADLPVGRKAGGFVFHHTRNTAATEMRAGGMDEADAMLVGGWRTTHVFKHYNLGNVDALRQRLSAARAAAVARLDDSPRQPVTRGRPDGSCTAPTQQTLASVDVVR